MKYQITDGTVSAGGVPVLSHINFEIKGREKIAVVGRNGAGKTTLLRLIAGELALDRDDKRDGPGITQSGSLTMGILRQQAFEDDSLTVEEALQTPCPCPDAYDRERYAYELEYDTLFTGFGFSREDKRKRLSDFSGGEQTKIALIRLLLAKPDLLLLDEPTNHLDLQTTEWLEGYLKAYEKAAVIVSHDRFFLDRTADVVYELEGGRLERYPGNYTHYREEKLKRLKIRSRAYENQQEELARLEELVERFKHKPRKAAFARAKRKTMERMVRIPKPREDDVPIFTGEIQPLIPGSKWVYQCEHLKIGYEKPLMEITMRIRKGQKIGILGDNGVGKTTFLKTVAGLVPPLGGAGSLGNHTLMGYFDQFSAEIESEKSVAEHFHDLFPALTEKEVRSALGAYLFPGKEAGKQVSSLSGGEKARLALAELLQSRPNLLILDEPTNHMDIQAKETLESAFRSYKGTILFVSHDRYFIRQVADAMLMFEKGSAMYYPFGYEHYLDRRRREAGGESVAARIKAEEQALIAGMRAVPKAERHRLKEVSTEEAYGDWKLRLARERLEEAGERVERLEERLLRLREERLEAWGRQMAGLEEESVQRAAERRGAGLEELEASYGEAVDRHEKAWEEWNRLCMEWFEAALF